MSMLLWNDTWLDMPLTQMLPELHSFAKGNSQTLASLLRNADISQHFHTPLSAQAFLQFKELRALLEQHCNHDIQDRWCLPCEKKKFFYEDVPCFNWGH